METREAQSGSCPASCPASVSVPLPHPPPMEPHIHGRRASCTQVSPSPVSLPGLFCPFSSLQAGQPNIIPCFPPSLIYCRAQTGARLKGEAGRDLIGKPYWEEEPQDSHTFIYSHIITHVHTHRHRHVDMLTQLHEHMHTDTHTHRDAYTSMHTYLH